jgi:hypothetical protein
LNPHNGNLHHQSTEAENLLGRRPFSDSNHSGCNTPTATASLAGVNLTSVDHPAPESRWIDPVLAERTGLRQFDALAGGEIIGRKSDDYDGILIPYSLFGSDRVREYRSRRDPPDLRCDAAGNLKPRQKYLIPPGGCLCVGRDGLRSRRATCRECR